MHMNPEWQTPPDGDFASYIEQLNLSAALRESMERRRQSERAPRPAPGTARRALQKKAALPAPQPAAASAPRPVPASPAPASPAQASALVGKVIIGVIVAFIVLMLLAETEDGMDMFGFFIIAFIAWRVFWPAARTTHNNHPPKNP